MVIVRFVFGKRDSSVERSNRVIAMSSWTVPAEFERIGMRRDCGRPRLRSSGGLITHV
jgi:hypothetical protein